MSASACDGDGAATTDGTPWVVMDSWALVPPDHDPVAGRPPALEACSADALRIEFGVPELSTEVCPWVTIVTSTRRALDPGAELDIAFVHDVLVAPEPATATLVVQTRAEVLFETTLTVPQDAGVVEALVSTTASLPANSEVFVHVHNHGANAYRLIALEPVM